MSVPVVSDERNNVVIGHGRGRGITASLRRGPCDRLLAAIANRLVGNDLDATTIEYTLKGNSYEIATDSCRITVAGDFDFRIEGRSAQPWRSYMLTAGQRFSVGYANRGVRGYLAVEGGFALTSVLGSTSVHTRSGIGPRQGRPVQTGELLPLQRATAEGRLEGLFDPAAWPKPVLTLRVVWGPQDHYFDEEARLRFCEADFVVTPRCDRMGYQLSGPIIAHRKELPLISEGVALGSIQVPGDGLFIANMVDRQTVGGYAKIATIISADGMRSFSEREAAFRTSRSCYRST
jgi:biotin-dependent carboxylase-like uncharacterized protein